MRDGELSAVQATEQMGESMAGVASVVIRYYDELADSGMPPSLVDSLVCAFHALLIGNLIGHSMGYDNDSDTST